MEKGMAVKNCEALITESFVKIKDIKGYPNKLWKNPGLEKSKVRKDRFIWNGREKDAKGGIW